MSSSYWFDKDKNKNDAYGYLQQNSTRKDYQVPITRPVSFENEEAI